MNRLRHRALILATIVAFPSLVFAKRVAPEWQATRNTSLRSTERCVTAHFERFGRTRVDHGEKPEAGKIRLHLLKRYGRADRTVATLTLNGDSKFSSIWLDSDSERLGRAIWKDLKKSCRLHVLGEPH